MHPKQGSTGQNEGKEKKEGGLPSNKDTSGGDKLVTPMRARIGKVMGCCRLWLCLCSRTVKRAVEEPKTRKSKQSRKR